MGDFLRGQWWVVPIFIGTMVPLARRFATAGVMETLRTLDRRWIFLLMLWAVLLPIYFIGVTGRTFPELPSALAHATFDEVDRLSPGDHRPLASSRWRRAAVDEQELRLQRDQAASRGCWTGHADDQHDPPRRRAYDA